MKYTILIPCAVALTELDQLCINETKEYYRKVHAPESVEFEIVERAKLRKQFKEPKRNFVNKFNKNNHRK